jgi:hypothetical protein
VSSFRTAAGPYTSVSNCFAVTLALAADVASSAGLPSTIFGGFRGPGGRRSRLYGSLLDDRTGFGARGVRLLYARPPLSLPLHLLKPVAHAVTVFLLLTRCCHAMTCH